MIKTQANKICVLQLKQCFEQNLQLEVLMLEDNKSFKSVIYFYIKEHGKQKEIKFKIEKKETILKQKFKKQ